MGCPTMVSNRHPERSTSHDSFLEYFKKSRLLKVGLTFNIFYYSCVLLGFVFYSLQGSLGETAYTVDFQVFYEAGQAFLSSPDSIYTVGPNGLPFRYFPFFAVIMALFTAVPLVPLYLINITLMKLLNFGVIALAYRVSLNAGATLSTKNFEKTLFVLLITPPHIVNLILGQISQLAIVLVLVVLILLQSSSDDSFSRFFWAGITLGIASTLKPFFLVLAPFLIPLTWKAGFRIKIPHKPLSGVSVGFLLSMLPNMVYFVAYPETLNGFLHVNFVEGLSSHHSTSITRLFSAILPFLDPYALQFGVILILGGFIFLRSFSVFVRAREDQKNHVRHFTEMMFLVLLVYPDSWFLFMAVWYALLGPSMLQLYGCCSHLKGEIRNLDILWSGANNLLAFFSIGVVLYYLVLGFDPVIPIWLTVLYVLYERILSQCEKASLLSGVQLVAETVPSTTQEIE